MDGRILGIFFLISLLITSSILVPGAFAQKDSNDEKAEINGPGGLMSETGIGRATHPTPSNPLEIKEHHPAHIKKFIGPSFSPSVTTVYAPSTVWPAYGFNSLSCTHTTTAPSGWNDPNLCGHGQTIAIVDAFDHPNIESDLQTFDAQFGLPACTVANGCFVKSAPAGITTDSGWALEISLDVEWAHAIAPGAKIVLVESPDNTLGGLLGAQSTAVGTGAQQVSDSWGGNEFSSESSYDSYFNSPTASFFVASGDSGHGAEWPASSPFAIAVGGTTLNVDSSGNWLSETAWSGSGGGLSAYESKPGYQNNFLSGTQRGVPDVAYNADPNTGVYVYDSIPMNGASGWWAVGGTSAGAPQWAGISAIANSHGAKLASASFGTSVALYKAAAGAQSTPQVNPYLSNYHDIISGSNGACGSACNAGPGYDLVTGLGSPRANNLIPYLTPAPNPDFAIISSPSSLTVRQGSSGSSTITVNSLNGFNSAVGLTVSAPASVTASVLPTSVTPPSGGSVTSTLSISVPSGTVPGTYTINVTGTSGLLSHSTSVSVSVPTPDFALASNPSSLTINFGGSSSSTVTASSLNGFSGTVGLSVTWPPNLSGTLSSSSVQVTTTNPGSSGLAIKAQSGPSGTYSVTVTGTSSTLTHTITIPVTVLTAPSAPQNLVATGGNNKVSLSWNAPASNGGSAVTSYNIYRSTTTGGEGLTPYKIGVTSTSYVDNGLTNGIAYYYQVTGINSVGESSKSGEASATPQQTPTLSVSVSTASSSYPHRSYVYIVVTVTSNSLPVSGASVNLTVTTPNGSTAHGIGTTYSNGQIAFWYYIGQSAPSGTYTVSAKASASGYNPGSGSTTFQVT